VPPLCAGRLVTARAARGGGSVKSQLPAMRAARDGAAALEADEGAALEDTLRAARAAYAQELRVLEAELARRDAAEARLAAQRGEAAALAGAVARNEADLARLRRARDVAEERGEGARREWLRLVLVAWRVMAAARQPEAAEAAATHPHIKALLRSQEAPRTARAGGEAGNARGGNGAAELLEEGRELAEMEVARAAPPAPALAARRGSCKRSRAAARRAARGG
jgi:hypothetical protein